MDIPVQASDVIIGGSGNYTEKDFSIAQTRHTFQILSSGLYSDKEKAIVRELSCNAWDSHAEAGTKDTPFVLYLPNRIEPFFKIRDYGTGMSHDDVMDVYTKYFESTKKQTNNQIGCFGLGSKSPFAYTKNFSVVSFFNGEKRTYNMIISAEGLPRVIHVATEDTDEDNGVEVSFAVKIGDHRDFFYAAQSVLRPFDTLPDVKGNPGFSVSTEPGVLVSKNLWKVYAGYNSAAGMPQQCAIMGNVEYPLVSQSGFSSNARMVLKLPISIRFPIGSFEVTPSRETISWTDFSEKNVNQILEDVYDEIVDHINTSISGAKTMWEARLKTYSLTHTSSLSKLKVKPVWKGRPVSIHAKVPKECSVTHMEATRRLVKSKYVMSCSSSRTTSIDPAETDFFLADIKASKTRVASYVRDLDEGKHVYLISPISNKAYKEFLRSVGISAKAVRVASSIPKKVRTYSGVGNTAPRSRIAGTKARVFVLGEYLNYTRADECWEEKEVDLASGGVYVQIHRYKVVTYPGASVDDAARPACLRAAISFLKYTLGDKAPDIVGVKTAGLTKFSSDPNWVDLTTFIRNSVLDLWFSDKDLRTAYYLMHSAVGAEPDSANSKRTLEALTGVDSIMKGLVKEGYDKETPTSPIFRFHALSRRITSKEDLCKNIDRVGLWWRNGFSLVSLYSGQSSPDFRGALFKSYPMLKIAESGKNWENKSLWDSPGKREQLKYYIKFMDGLRAQGVKV